MESVKHRDNHRDIRIQAKRASVAGRDIIHGPNKMTVRTMQGKSFVYGLPCRPSTPVKGIIQ